MKIKISYLPVYLFFLEVMVNRTEMNTELIEMVEVCHKPPQETEYN